MANEPTHLVLLEIKGQSLMSSESVCYLGLISNQSLTRWVGLAWYKKIGPFLSKNVYLIFSNRFFPYFFVFFLLPTRLKDVATYLGTIWCLEQNCVLLCTLFFDLIACSLYFCRYFYFRLAGGYTRARGKTCLSEDKWFIPEKRY